MDSWLKMKECSYKQPASLIDMRQGQGRLGLLGQIPGKHCLKHRKSAKLPWHHNFEPSFIVTVELAINDIKW